MSEKYKASGVSLERGYESVRRIKKHTIKTLNKGTMSDIGSFGGLFDLSKYKIKEPILVSGTDGVGTKLLIAQMADKHDTIGIDLVAMCVNDVITCGAMPLFFLDYIATGKVIPSIVEQIVKGISDGCVQAGTNLIGGETAEMPSMYHDGHYDLAGFTTGVVEKSQLLNIDNVESGDKIIGLASSGIHSNGYSLVRKIFFEDNDYELSSFIDELGTNLQTELLKPTKIYVKGVLELISKVKVHSIAHITGGGFIENIPRAIPKGLGVKIYQDNFDILPVFTLLSKLGNISKNEMYNIFNMGIGMIVIVKVEDVDQSLSILKSFNYNPQVIGDIINDEGVEIV